MLGQSSVAASTGSRVAGTGFHSPGDRRGTSVDPAAGPVLLVSPWIGDFAPMTRRKWMLELDGKEHTVELEHTYLSSKSAITLDGALIHKSSKLIDSGS